MTEDLAARVAFLERQLAALISPEYAPHEAGAVFASEEGIAGALADTWAALAPLHPLLEDDSVNDILINGPADVFVERAGKLERANLSFPSDAHVVDIAKAIAAYAGRSISLHKPLLDARLPDGSRVNAIIRPLALDGTAISIRKFPKHHITLDDMRDAGNLSFALAELLKVAARCRLNILISGGTGSGKTTLLNAVAEHIAHEERVVTIEDAAELRLPQPHVVRLETRPISLDRRDVEVTIRDLMKNALRMRPDRIIVGEVRGAEAFDMMQAMNTGHEGSYTTIHANHPRDALSRLENMMTMANLNLPTQSIRSQIASAIHLVVQVSRMRDGKRRVAFVSEVIGMESDVITMQDLFIFRGGSEEASGEITGEFKWTGIMPRFMRRVAYYGEEERLARAFGMRAAKR